MHSKSETVPFRGSIITCGIDYSNELLLDRALRFSDKPYDQVDIIDMKYETDNSG